MKHPDPLHFLATALDELDARGQLRDRAPALDPEAVSFCSNDYLGFAANPAPPVASGAGASRLIAGERDEHVALEEALASFLGTETALLFTSGYAANVGTLSALLRPGDLVVSDALNHASLIDGMRLARVTPVVVPHLDLGAVAAALADRARAQRAWVVVESYYSMDADGPDLRALRDLCDANGAALVVDEAHAVGVLGPDGRGRCAEAGVRADVLVGTLGKSLGSQGAYVAGSELLRRWLWNRARAFVFSTGLAPAAAEAARRSLHALRADPARPRRVLELASTLRRGILAGGVAREARAATAHPDTPQLVGEGHVLPIVVGAEARALRLAALLTEGRIPVRAVRPPTVPDGTARVRLTVTARHRDEDIARAVDVVRDALGRL